MAASQLQMIAELLDRRDVKKAEVAAAKLLRTTLSQPERAQALVMRARARLLNGRPDEAMADLDEARALAAADSAQPGVIELTADCHLLRFEMASVGFADRGETIRAQQLYSRIVSEFPQYVNLGWVYYQLGRVALIDADVDRADAYFRAALFAPSHVATLTAFCYERLGFIAFYERRSPDSALGFLDKALYTCPADGPLTWIVQVYILRSRVLRAMNQHHLALAAAEKALALAENTGVENRAVWAEALLAAAELAVSLPGREREAVSHLQQFLQISRKPLGVDVTWSRVYEMLGDAYTGLSQFEQAASAFRSALQYNPYHPWEASLLFRIARACYQHSSYEDAVVAVQQYVAVVEQDGDTVQDYRVYDVLGNAQFALGRYAEAFASYETALHLAPANASDLDKIRRYQQFAQELR
ncbi:MAG: hypothetical protein BroJett033_0610 [Chloroflexota bacterium]|nr:MAG: hypothetical protein BroJett033_0610 [Chloroflexota bacterium]